MFEFLYNDIKRAEKYLEFEKSLKGLDSEIGELARTFNSTVKDFRIAASSTDDKTVKSSIHERSEFFKKQHLRAVGEVKRKRDKLTKSMQALKTDSSKFIGVIEKSKKKEAFDAILKSYREGVINTTVCDSLIKAKTKEKARYADNIVINERGLILLLKRSEIDKSHPGYYTVPGGHVDLGEDCETAAKRELEEEAGIKVEEVTKVGEYEDEKCRIEYFQSHVENAEPVLQEEEIWSYEWVEPKDIKNYKLPFNMGENLMKILFPFREQVIQIKKSFETGTINAKTRDNLIGIVIEKARAGIGEIRHWQGGDYKKISNGKWAKISGDREKKVAVSGIVKKIKEEINLLSSKFEEERVKFKKSLETDYSEGTAAYKVFFSRNWQIELESNPFLVEIRNQQKDLYEEISEINKQLEVDRKKEREDKAGKKEVDAADISSLFLPLHKLFQDVKNNIKQSLPADQVAPVISINDYYIDTETSFNLVEEYSPSFEMKDGAKVWRDNVKSKWEEMKESGKFEHTHSPKSSSEYLVDKSTGDIFRMADHWGNCASCYWGNLWENNYGIGVSNIKDFKRRGLRNWFNPVFRDKIVEASEISLNELKNLVKRDDIYLTKEARDRVSNFTNKIFNNELKYSAALGEDQINEFKKKYEDLFEEKYLNKSEELDIEKAWKAAQIGEIRTHGDGKKYKKVSETGDPAKDWQLVRKDRSKQDGSDKSPKQGGDGTSEGKKKLSNKELNEAAKNASEAALNNAIKQSDDPKIREAAHKEIDRREKEEKVQEEPEKKEDVVDKKEQKKRLTIKDKVEELSDKYKDLMTQAMNDDFSDPNKTSEYSKKQKEYSRYIQRVSRFSSDDKLVGLLELKKMFGLKSEKEVKDFFGGGEIISISVINKEVAILTEDCYCERKFNDDGTVEMLEFILNPDLDKGLGRGSEIFFNQVNSFKKKGFKSLSTEAMKSDVYNGYYTWARLGYGFSKSISGRNFGKENFEDLIYNANKYNKDLKDVNSLQELISSQEGRDFWKRSGFTFKGSFDLSDDSESMFILNKYMEEKKNAKK